MTAATTVFLAGLGGIVVYYLATLMIWLGHFLPHHPSSRLREFHIGGHHRHYPDANQLRRERFQYGKGRNDSLVPQLPWLLGLGFVLWLALPAGWGLAAMSEVALVAVLNSYIHMHFHLSQSWLSSYTWFRKARAAHDLHHGQDVNFMVGDHFWDRCFGTYHPPG